MATKEQMRDELEELGVPLEDTEGLLHKALETLLEDTREEEEEEEVKPTKGRKVKVIDINGKQLTYPNLPAAQDYVKLSGGKIVA